MLKAGYNLISRLIGDSVASPGTVTTYVPHPEAYRTKAPSRGHPSISRQIQYEPEEYE
jgi:hypothetical protein